MKTLSLLIFLLGPISLTAQTKTIVLRSGNGILHHTSNGLTQTLRLQRSTTPLVLEIAAGNKKNTAVSVKTDRDSTRFTLRLYQKISILVPLDKDTARLQFTGVPRNARFSDQYIRERRGRFDVVIPEVQELAKILVALSKGGSSDSGITNMRTRYYQEVKAHFTPFANHPLIDTINRFIKDGSDSSYWYYYDWKMNANAYTFTPAGKIVHKGVIRKMGFRETNDPFVTYAALAADFAAKSDFRSFYAAHKPYYDSLVQQYHRYNPVREMKAWLERQFPYTYDYYLITYSPLTSGAHSTGSFEDNGFRQTVMFIAGVTINPALNQAVNEMANSRVVFTEIDHNYVNPAAEQYAAEIAIAMKEKATWWKGHDDNSPYADPMSAFQEYMTWAVFSLYCLDRYSEPDVMTYIDRMERQMEQRRGFNNFKAFNRELMRLYRHYQHRKTAGELYPEIIEWCKKQ